MRTLRLEQKLNMPRTPELGKGARKGGARVVYKAHILPVMAFGAHWSPQLPCLLGSRVKVGRDSPVLFPRRKQLMKIDVS